MVNTFVWGRHCKLVREQLCRVLEIYKQPHTPSHSFVRWTATTKALSHLVTHIPNTQPEECRSAEQVGTKEPGC